MRVFVVALGTVVVLSTSARAFDGHRIGFVLGGGVGPAYIFQDSYGDRSEGWGIILRVNAGMGLSDQTLFLLSSRVASFQDERHYGLSNTIIGVGFMHFFRQASPSFFGEFALGLARWPGSSGGFSSSSGRSGTGFWVGTGFEPFRHWMLNLGFGLGDGSGVTTKSIGLAFTWLSY